MTTELVELVRISREKAENKATHIANQFKHNNGVERLSTRLNSSLLAHAKFMAKGLEARYLIGIDLIALKKVCHHGNWESMLKRVGFNSRQSAQKYIDLAYAWDLIQDEIARVGVLDLSLTQALNYAKSLENQLSYTQHESIVEMPDDLSVNKAIAKKEVGQIKAQQKWDSQIDRLVKKSRSTIGELLTYYGSPAVDATIAEIWAMLDAHLKKEDKA